MEITVIEPPAQPPVDRAFALSMVIKSFKGRRDVEVHLFRPDWDPVEEAAYDWDALLGAPLEGGPASSEQTRKVLLEAFTAEERDRIIDYLKDQYATRLASIAAVPLDLPVPVGLPPLCSLSEGKDIGFIRFEKIPSYSLDIPMRGFYDLSRHRPLVEEDPGE